MKLSNNQLANITRALERLESADHSIQTGLPASDLCYDLHLRIEDICAELEQLIEEGEFSEI